MLLTIKHFEKGRIFTYELAWEHDVGNTEKSFNGLLLSLKIKRGG